eukprot:396234-Pyramimonas_sp.AAC.1
MTSASPSSLPLCVSAGCGMSGLTWPCPSSGRSALKEVAEGAQRCCCLLVVDPERDVAVDASVNASWRRWL